MDSAKTTCGRKSDRNSLSTVTRRALLRGAERTVTVAFQVTRADNLDRPRQALAAGRLRSGAIAESASVTSRNALARDRRLEGTDHAVRPRRR